MYHDVYLNTLEKKEWPEKWKMRKWRKLEPFEVFFTIV